jgi:hypothetical protein
VVLVVMARAARARVVLLVVLVVMARAARARVVLLAVLVMMARAARARVVLLSTVAALSVIVNKFVLDTAIRLLSLACATLGAIRFTVRH